MPADEPAFLFVLGTGRCGSTLVQEVLARHRDAAFVSNFEDNSALFNWTDRWNGSLYRLVPQRFTTKGRVRYAPSEAYNALDREVSPILSMPFRDLRRDDVTPWLAKRFRRFFEERARAQRKPVFIHKFTGWPRARFIQAILPQSRFINVVRDGRAVANSWLQMPWWLGYQGPDHWQWGPLPHEYAREWEESGRSFASLAGILWKMLIDEFEAARGELPDGQWLDIRYEDVVGDPAAAFDSMLRFAGLEPDAPFHQQLARQSFSSSRADAFRRDLDEHSLAMLDRSLAEHLERYGYSI